VVSALTTNTRPFHGTDGRVHLVYELVLTNTSPTPTTLNKIEVVDGSTPSKTLASYDGRGLLSCLQTTGRLTAENSTIDFAQRFAIDWKQLDEAGRFVHGDPSNVHNYDSQGNGAVHRAALHD
jgi:hypothetical protein